MKASCYIKTSAKSPYQRQNQLHFVPPQPADFGTNKVPESPERTRNERDNKKPEPAKHYAGRHQYLCRHRQKMLLAFEYDCEPRQNKYEQKYRNRYRHNRYDNRINARRFNL